MDTFLSPIVAIMGYSNSGKTTTAEALTGLIGVKHIRFSYPMKRFLAERYGVTLEFLDSQEGKDTAIYPYDPLTYGEQMSRMWEASSGDRPLIDPRIWMAETEAEIDSSVAEAAAAIVFSDVRNQREVDLLRSMVEAGHKLILVAIGRSGQVMKVSDAGMMDYYRQLKETAMFKLEPVTVLEFNEGKLSDIVKVVHDVIAYREWYSRFVYERLDADLSLPWGGETFTGFGSKPRFA